MKAIIIKILKIFICIGSSIIIGFLLNYYVTSEVITIYFSGMSSLYSILTVFALLIQIIAAAGVIYMICRRDCPKYIVALCVILYIIIMVILLFGRSTSERMINMNIMELFSVDALSQNILNFIFFVPIGYFLRKKKFVHVVITSICLVAAIEALQLILRRGVFDIVDIIIDIVAILVGFGLIKRIKK